MRVGLAFIVLTALAGSANAQTALLRDNLAVDGTVTGVGAALWLSSEFVFKSELAPANCRWCSRDAQGNDTLNAFDRDIRDELVWSNRHTADMLSNIAAFGLVPLVALGGTAVAAHHDGAGANIGSDLLVIGEATVLAQDLDQLVKFSVGRERPFVHRLAPDQKSLTAAPDDNNLSFFSGHTTFTFALATASGTICSMQGYRYAPLVWAGSLTLATTTGLLRIGADKHYASDVIVGALVGTAFGIGVPRLFHSPTSPSERPQSGLGLSSDPSVGGMTFGYGGHF